MNGTLDLEEEAKAAEALAESLKRIDAPHELIDQARQQVADLRSRAAARIDAETKRRRELT